MDQQDAKKIQALLAQLKARKAILTSTAEKSERPVNAPSMVYDSKLRQTTREHVTKALKDWKVL